MTTSQIMLLISVLFAIVAGYCLIKAKRTCTQTSAETIRLLDEARHAFQQFIDNGQENAERDIVFKLLDGPLLNGETDDWTIQMIARAQDAFQQYLDIDPNNPSFPEELKQARNRVLKYIAAPKLGKHVYDVRRGLYHHD